MVSTPSAVRSRISCGSCEPASDLPTAARRLPAHLDDRRAEQPRHDVELVDRRAGDAELEVASGAALTPRLMQCTSTRRADRPASMRRACSSRVAGVEAAHEARRDSSASPAAPALGAATSPRTRRASARAASRTAPPCRPAPRRRPARRASESCEAMTTASTAGSAISANASSSARRPDARRHRLGPGEVDVRDGGDLGAPDGAAQRVRVVGAHDPGADHADPQCRRPSRAGHRASDERRRSVCAASSAANVSWSQSFSSARQMSSAWVSGFRLPTGWSRSRFVGNG